MSQTSLNLKIVIFSCLLDHPHARLTNHIKTFNTIQKLITHLNLSYLQYLKKNIFIKSIILYAFFKSQNAIHLALFFTCLLSYMSQDKHLVYATSPCPKTALSLAYYSVSYLILPLYKRTITMFFQPSGTTLPSNALFHILHN